MSELLNYREQPIGGTWRAGAGGETQAVDPYTVQAWAVVTTSTAADVDHAVRGAREASLAWRRTPGVERARLLLALADAIEHEQDRLALLETRDNGKIIRENANQITFAARNYRFHAGMADKLSGQTKPLDRYDTLDYTTREPLGVVALITAWNSPLQILSNKLAPALAAGNSVVIKPSEHTSVSTLAFARIVEEVGFPAGVVNVVIGGPETGQALTSHEGIDKISFTGGATTARLIAADAARTLVPATFELGGKGANIIFADADMDRAIPGAVSGVFAAAGQTCVAGSRLLVEEEVYEGVVKAVAERAEAVKLGNPLDEATQMGPMAHRQQFDTVLDHIERAKRGGAALATGGEPAVGHPRGLFIKPTIFRDVDPRMHIAREEVFGPVLVVIPFRDVDHAIQIANGTDHGLAAGLWTRNINRAHTVARELECGSVWVNTYRTSAAQAPFGGVKQSGYGRERGIEGLDEYTRVKNTMIDLSDTVRDPFLLGT